MQSAESIRPNPSSLWQQSVRSKGCTTALHSLLPHAKAAYYPRHRVTAQAPVEVAHERTFPFAVERERCQIRFDVARGTRENSRRPNVTARFGAPTRAECRRSQVPQSRAAKSPQGLSKHLPSKRGTRFMELGVAMIFRTPREGRRYEPEFRKVRTGRFRWQRGLVSWTKR